MSDDDGRIKLPWEDRYDSEPVASHPEETTRVEGVSPQSQDVAESTAVDQFGALEISGAQADVIDSPIAGEPPAVPISPTVGTEMTISEAGPDEAAAAGAETSLISWSSGAVSRRERSRVSGPGHRPTMAWARLKSRLRGEDRADGDEEWFAEVEHPREIGGWLNELHLAESPSDQPEMYRGSSSITSDFAAGTEGEFDSSIDVLAGPRAEVVVPRISRGRVGVISAAALALALLVGVYAVLVPSINGRNYRSELRSAFSETGELRASLPDVLAGGTIPKDPGGAGMRYRELANSYSLYAKVVAAPPPTKPLVSLSSSMSDALGARESLLALNDSLGPAVEQVRSRGNYLDTIAAVADQMRIAQSVLVPDGQADAESILISEATVANATSLNAVLGTMRPPTGYEALHAKVLSQLGEYVRTGREYSLALKKADEGVAATLRESLYRSAKSFEDVIGEPVDQGIDSANLAAIEVKSEEATRRLE